MRIGLVYPQTNFEKNYNSFWLPYSILTVASQVADKQHIIKLFDGHIIETCDLDFSNFDVLGVSAMIGNQIRDAIEVFKEAKRVNKSIKTVLGGPFPTLALDIAKQMPNVDYIIQGQGEIPFENLINTLNSTLNQSAIEGVYVSQSQEYSFLPPISREALKRYDFSLVENLEDYIKEDININSRTINYISSQGCLFNCGFCSDTNLYLRKYLTDNLSNTISDIEFLNKKYKVNGIKFYDSNFFMNPRRGLQFAELLLKNSINIRWAGAIHPYTLLKYSDEEMNLLTKSGLSRLLVGLESPNNEALNLVGKGKLINKDSILSVVERNKKFGIHGSYTMVLGFPGIPKTHEEETISFGRLLRKIDPLSEVKIHIYYPYLMTQLYPYAIKHGFVPNETLDYYSNIDYYENMTPFVSDETKGKVTQFNKEHSLSVK